jgi:hypothetical protein
MRALWIAAGIAIWALHFAAAYGFTALACARGWEAAVPWVVGGATLAAVGAIALLTLALWPRRAHFIEWMAIAVAALALVAILLEAVPVMMVPPCA